MEISINRAYRASLENLDKLVRPEIYALHRAWPAFQVCGCIGLALAILLAAILIIHLGLSLWVLTWIVLAAVLTFFALVMITKIMTGEERIIYYHHEIAVMVVAAILLWLLRQPLLPYLGVTILGIGMFLTCGRVGCFMVGCCHGRPHEWGVCYREDHAAAGFTSYYVGVRLFPIQAVESLWVLGAVLVGAASILSGHAPGDALAWYGVTYNVGRFCFEFFRGDPERPYYWGFSQPQWISLILMLFIVGAELSGGLTFHTWHIGATATMVVAMIAVSVKRRFQKIAKHRLLHPRHIKEVAEAVESAYDLATEGTAIPEWTIAPAAVHVGSTSLGIQISASKIRNAGSCIHHYALSSQNGVMAEVTAKTLAGLILQLKYPSSYNEIIQGNHGVYHLLIHPQSGKIYSASPPTSVKPAPAP
jgi:prolipoprotein diacylglyceryltransferase